MKGRVTGPPDYSCVVEFKARTRRNFVSLSDVVDLKTRLTRAKRVLYQGPFKTKAASSWPILLLSFLLKTVRAVRQNRAPFRGAHVQQNMSFGVQEQVEFVGNRAPPRGAQFQQNINFGVQEQGEFGECRVLPRGAQVQQSMNFGIEGQCGIWENGAPSAQERVYYGNTTESFVPVQFNPNNQPQIQYQAFALPQSGQDGFVSQPWPYQHPVQGAQMELEMELQKVKLSGQYAKVLKELPILNGTEGKEAIIDFFTALETRTTEWSSEKIMEVMQIKVKGKAREEAAAAVTRFGNTISLKDLRTEIAKALYGEERLEKGPQQDRRAEPISHHRLSAGEELDVGVELESQNQQILEKNPSQNNFLDNVSFGEFGQTTFAPKKLPLEISFTSEETAQFVNLKRLRASSVAPIQSFFWETPVHGTRMLQPACCLESSNGALLGHQQAKFERKRLEKAEVSLKSADEERIKTLGKQLELVSKERDKLKTLVESFIEGKETNRKSRKVLAHKLRKIFPVEKPEKTVTTGKRDLAQKMAHSSLPRIVQNPSEILVTPPTRGRVPVPNSVKSQQKEHVGKAVRSKAFETGSSTGMFDRPTSTSRRGRTLEGDGGGRTNRR
uniref:Uncharacterized protein n=1 Tax=Globodera rostochiensis TaxID=31243 RepID=A0A914HC64_GLORO